MKSLTNLKGITFGVVMIFLLSIMNSSARGDESTCAQRWTLNSWWDEPAIFKYSPVLGSTPNAQFKSPLSNGLFAPQLSNEALEMIRKQGKDIIVQFFVSRKNDLNFDPAFRPIDSGSFSSSSKRYLQKDTEYRNLPLLQFPNVLTLFPSADLATKVRIEQPNCKVFDVTSPYHVNPNYSVPKMSSDIWNNYWKAIGRDFKQIEIIKEWEKTFLVLTPKPLSVENSVGINRWYELSRSDLFGPTVFNYDWKDCQGVKTLTEFEKDVSKSAWEMVFLEAPIYGVGLLTTSKGNVSTSCLVDIYFMLSDWYGEPALVLFYLGQKTITIPALGSKPSPTPSTTKSESSISPKPSPSAKKSSTINCIKGKSTLKVIGKNPKCPKGYKKK